jgi:hypothetical protein
MRIGFGTQFAKEPQNKHISVRVVPARGAQEAVQRHDQSEKRASGKNHPHEQNGLGMIGIRRSQKAKHGRRRQESRHGEQTSEDDGEQNRLVENTAGILCMGRAEFMRDERCGALAQAAGHGCDQKIKRKGNRKGRDGLGAQPTRADHVHHIEKRVEQHPKSRRNRNRHDEARQRIGR